LRPRWLRMSGDPRRRMRPFARRVSQDREARCSPDYEARSCLCTTSRERVDLQFRALLLARCHLALAMGAYATPATAVEARRRPITACGNNHHSTSSPRSQAVAMPEKPKRLTPTNKTLREIFLKSGNLCAFPSCTNIMMDADGTFIGNLCHIEA